MGETIDNLDYSILKCIQDADQALWKKKVYQQLTEHQHRYPVQDSVSAQTIGRRIDNLEDSAYLDSRIISPEAVNRNLIIGYQLTADGERILEEKRRVLLERILSEELFGGNPVPVEKPALEELIHSEFAAGLSVNNATEAYNRKQLLLLLAKYFVEEGMMNEFSPEQQEQFASLLP